MRAEQMHDQDAQRTMLGIALTYDSMARRADARESAEKGQPSPLQTFEGVQETLEVERARLGQALADLG